ncbi:hypothetical protein [Phocaeicola abscessus]
MGRPGLLVFLHAAAGHTGYTNEEGDLPAMRFAARTKQAACLRCDSPRERRRRPACDATRRADEEGDLPAIRLAARTKKATCLRCDSPRGRSRRPACDTTRRADEGSADHRNSCFIGRPIHACGVSNPKI